LTTLAHRDVKRINDTFFALKVETKKAVGQEASVRDLATLDTNVPASHFVLIQEDPQQKHNERLHLTSLPWSPWVAGIIDAFHDSQNFYTLLELVPCGNLNSFLYQNGCLTAMQACFYFSNILCALRFLHNHHIVHRDLKPGNILIGEDGYLVLGDFGCSKSQFEDKGWEFGGTPLYMAPEMIRCEPKCGPAVDWWAAGCILYQMLTGNMVRRRLQPLFLHM
jgi:serine/threonine protein kinase